MKLEIKGKQRAFDVALLLLESGYSIHIPYVSQDKDDDENNYFIIECSLVKYGDPSFILEEEE
jgi:hypothetical protein